MKLLKHVCLSFILALVLGSCSYPLFQRLPSIEYSEKGLGSPAPVLSIDAGSEQSEYWDKGFEDVYKTLLMNLNPPNSYFAARYAWPSPTFRSAYLWDTAFISQVWKPWDVQVAQEVNQALIDHADGAGCRISQTLTARATTPSRR